jgi:hypothetical protein
MRTPLLWTAILAYLGAGNLLILVWPSVRHARERVREIDRLEELWRVSHASELEEPSLEDQGSDMCARTPHRP